MSIGTIISYIPLVIVFVLMLSVLVAAHEYGHYLFARIFGMGVEEFAIGFGKKPIWTWMRKSYEVDSVSGPTGGGKVTYPTSGSGALQPEVAPSPAATKLALRETTDFTVRPWPLGGFVRIKGMVPEEDGSEINIPGGFYSKAPWKRFIVLLAGPVFSVLAGVIILTGVFAFDGMEKVSTKPVLGSVGEDGAAGKAGMKQGDVIVSINGNKITTFFDITTAMKEAGGKSTEVVYSREGTETTVKLVPETKFAPVMSQDMESLLPAQNWGRLGVSPSTEKIKVGLGAAMIEAAQRPIMVVGKLAELVTKPAELKESVGGPVSIVRATNDAMKTGVTQVFGLAAMLSISVGIFNLLPIPPLDGGQMLVAIAEMLRRGKRLSIKVQGAVTGLGMAIVLLMFISIMFIDVGRLTAKKEEPKPAPKVETKTK